MRAPNTTHTIPRSEAAPAAPRRGPRAPLLLALSVAWACAAGAAAGQTSVADDRRLSEEAMGLLARAGKDGSFAQAEGLVRSAIFRRLARGPLDRMGALTDQVYVLRACRYMALADRLDPGRKLSAWLGDHRAVSRVLFRAMQDVPPADDANTLRKWQALLAADEKKVLAYVNLSVALATSRPRPHYVRQPAPASMIDAFGWYTDANIPFRCDLKALPMEMCRYLADTQLSLAERRWALARFAATPDLPEVYFQVRYDMDYFFKGAPKKLAKVEYTLPNLLRQGGICVDQAYFASEVCKALGMPAAIVAGRNAAGEPHAWVACVKTRRQGNQTLAEWDAHTARYEEQKFYTGTVVDPASGKRIADSQLLLLGAAGLLPPDRREEADAAGALAALVAETLKADPNELKSAGKIGPEIVEKLLIEAANRNLAHRQVWELTIRLRKAGDLSTECLDRLLDFLIAHTAKDYPDYGCELVLQIAPTYEPARREKIYQSAADVYAHRPDLHGRVMVALGDDYVSRGKKDQALATYKQVMGAHHELTELLLTAARRAEDLLVAGRRRDLAIQMYTQLFAQAHKGDAAAADYPQSAYYQLGRRLAELLSDDGQADAAKKVRQKVGHSTRTIEGA